jgi:hypothetical protein
MRGAGETLRLPGPALLTSNPSVEKLKLANARPNFSIADHTSQICRARTAHV